MPHAAGGVHGQVSGALSGSRKQAAHTGHDCTWFRGQGSRCLEGTDAWPKGLTVISDMYIPRRMSVTSPAIDKTSFKWAAVRMLPWQLF
jgi:hypothetical protein